MGSGWCLPDMARELLFEKYLKKSLCLGLTFDLPIHIQGVPVLQYSLLFLRGSHLRSVTSLLLIHDYSHGVESAC